MRISEWEKFLHFESQRVINVMDAFGSYDDLPEEVILQYGISPEFPDEVIESEWLGFTGASEEEISAAETRLGFLLPHSYRSFLKVTNGWRGYGGLLPLYPINQVEWFSTVNQDWIDAYTFNMSGVAPSIPDSEYFVYGENTAQPPARMNHLQATLQISEATDGSVFLLNSNVVHDTEWEAWHFANYLPGAVRYRSFSMLFSEFLKIESDAHPLKE